MSKILSKKIAARKRRQKRVRVNMAGTSTSPRLSVYRSNTSIYAQLIDDEKGETLGRVSSLDIKSKGNKVDIAKLVGKQIAEVAKSKKIEKVVFDRGGNLYHGRVKALAEAAREAGLIF